MFEVSTGRVDDGFVMCSLVTFLKFLTVIMNIMEKQNDSSKKWSIYILFLVTIHFLSSVTAFSSAASASRAAIYGTKLSHDHKSLLLNEKKEREISSALHASLSLPRGGAAAGMSSLAKSSPSNFFNSALVSLGLATVVLKLLPRFMTAKRGENERKTSLTLKKPASAQSLQWRFLVVFWLLRIRKSP